MSDKPRRIDLHPDQFIAGIAAKMSPAELGVYWMVCLRIYSHGGQIPDTDAEIAGLFRKCNPRTIRAALDHLAEIGKVQRIDGELMANGCRTELDLAMKRIRTARENGSNGGRPSNQINEIAKPTGFPPQNPPAPSLSPSIPMKEGKEESPLVPQRGKRTATEFKEDWQPEQAEIAFANSLGFSTPQAFALADQCRDHHRSKGNRFKIHGLAFRTWLRKDVEMHGNPATRTNGKPINGHGSRPITFAEAVGKRDRANSGATEPLPGLSLVAVPRG